MADGILTHERLLELVSYDPLTGIFTRLRRRRGPRSDGFGSKNGDGYLFAMLDGRTYALHRLARFYVDGVWPGDEVDHRNGVRDDNRDDNLRDGDKTFNQQNRRTAERTNKSGFLGVSWCRYRNKWRAHICVEGRNRSLGRYDTPEAAHAAYVEAKRRLHPSNTL